MEADRTGLETRSGHDLLGLVDSNGTAWRTSTRASRPGARYYGASLRTGDQCSEFSTLMIGVA